MKEIVNRLHENRQIERAKSILESNGYKVSKKSKKVKRLKESEEYDEEDLGIQAGEVYTRDEAIKLFQKIKNNIDDYGNDPDVIDAILDVLEKNSDAIYYSELSVWDSEVTEHIIDDYEYFYKGYCEDAAGTRFYGYFDGNRDGMENFLHIPSMKS